MIQAIRHHALTKPIKQTINKRFINHVQPWHLDIAKTLSLTSVDHKKANQLIDYFSKSFETYLAMQSIKPVAHFLKTKGVDDLKSHMNDHMAFRTPNLETGVAMIQELLKTGLYSFEYRLNSNNNQQSKCAISDINIAGGKQYGITLLATSSAKKHLLPHYIFISINLNSCDMSNLYKNMNKPFKLSNDLNLYSCPFWEPAHKLTTKNGAFFPNHYTLKVNSSLLKILKCESIFELRHLFLQNGFKENTSLSIKDCPDVTQFALESQGDGVYFEYLTRSKDKYGQLIPGFSTNPTNINRIGSSAN
ncbi:MAG: hypothetical protein VXX85_04330 [Candidatus Margulisiibacteriota bacterium]|nr:hypothetical protein [Candidatus Margulisiibacteriota bacterium]